MAIRPAESRKIARQQRAAEERRNGAPYCAKLVNTPSTSASAIHGPAVKSDPAQQTTLSAHPRSPRGKYRKAFNA